jgi:hypothetical protein
MKIRIEQPEGYSLGAWKVEIMLNEAEKKLYQRNPFSFHLPKLPHRYFAWQQEFYATEYGGVKSPLKVKFVDGVSKGQLYTNGIEESENPTSLEYVLQALKSEINKFSLRG